MYFGYDDQNWPCFVRFLKNYQPFSETWYIMFQKTVILKQIAWVIDLKKKHYFACFINNSWAIWIDSSISNLRFSYYVLQDNNIIV